MIKAVVYKYTCKKSKKVYIGETINESRRRKEFFNLKLEYAGDKIYNARLKYPPKEGWWDYTVLESKEFSDKISAKLWASEREKHYIKHYDSVKGGYNISEGGKGCYSGKKIPKKEKDKTLVSLKQGSDKLIKIFDISKEYAELALTFLRVDKPSRIHDWECRRTESILHATWSRFGDISEVRDINWIKAVIDVYKYESLNLEEFETIREFIISLSDSSCSKIVELIQSGCYCDLRDLVISKFKEYREDSSDKIVVSEFKSKDKSTSYYVKCLYSNYIKHKSELILAVEKGIISEDMAKFFLITDYKEESKLSNDIKTRLECLREFFNN